MKVNRQQLSQIMGASLPTVDRWIRDGCPILQRGGKGLEWKFNLPDVIQWWGDRQRQAAAGTEKADDDELRRRKLRAETELVEIEVAKARGEVASVAQIELNLSSLFAEVRTSIRNIPSRVVSSLIGMTDEREFKVILLSEIDLALTALSESAVLIEPTEGGEETPANGKI